jgi:nitroreductase
MELKDLILRNRSYRRFRQGIPVGQETLLELVDLARLSGSASNLQPLKFILSADPERNAAIFPHLRWAGYLKDWDGPEVGEQPSAYIIILLDTGISKIAGCDHGIAAQSILLGAAEKGLGGCMIGSIQRTELRRVLNLDEQYEILLVLALGAPAEKVLLEEMDTGGDVKYWRDEKDAHHVPKRSLQEIILT